MALTPRSIALRLLKASGIVSTDPSHETNALLTRGIVDGDMEEVLITINAALQEICAEGPSALTEKSVAEVLRPPASITVSVEQYSKAVTVTSGWVSWMQGCTVRIAGDTQDNRFLRQHDIGATTSLMSPYMGTTGIVSATVYGDALPLPNYYLNILGPIELPDRCLHLAADPAAFRHGSDFYRSGYVVEESYSTFQTKAVGTPVLALVDADYDATRESLPYYLRVNPMPDRAYPITFRVKLTPLAFTMDDIESGDYETDPDSIIPQDWNESVLLPIALQRWQAHPSCVLGPTQREEIARQYTQAINFLQSLRPRTGSVTATYI